MHQETSMLNEVSRCTDAALLDSLQQLVRANRALSVRLLVHLGEMDARRLYREQAYPSMLEYAVTALRMSEAEAYLRIQAARLGRQFPLVLGLLGSGALHLTAEIAPKPDVPTQLRRLPQTQSPQARRTHLHDSLPATDLTPVVGPSVQPASTVCTTALVVSNARSVAESLAASASHSASLPFGTPFAAPASDAQQSGASDLDRPPAADTHQQAFALQSPRPRASCVPLSPGRYRLQLTLGQEAYDKLKQLKELLRHRVPDGDLAGIVELAIDGLLDKTMKQRFAQTAASKKPRATQTAGSRQRVAETDAPQERVAQAAPQQQRVAETVAPQQQRVDHAAAPQKLPAGTARLLSRYIPRAVVRQVHDRDGGQCTFVSAQGQRCAARGFLELHHHDTPYARGGKPTADNLRLTCRAHNALCAERDFGRGFMVRKLLKVRADRDSRAFHASDAPPSRQQPRPLLSLGPERVRRV